MPDIPLEKFAPDVTPEDVAEPPLLIDYDQMTKLPPADWLVESAVPRHAKSLMFGASNTFKSFLAVDLACCVATGIDWHGHKVKQGRVVYIATEGANGVGRLRIRGWMNAHHIPEKDRRNIFLVNRELWITDRKDVEEFLAAVNKRVDGIALFVVDVSAGTMAGSESDDETAKAWVAGLETIIRELSCSALCITHTGWADQSRARGHTHIWASFDTRLQVEGDKDTRTCVLRVNRHKDADSIGAWGFRLDTTDVVLGETTLVPVLDESVDTGSKGKKTALNDTQKRALDVFHTLAADIGKPAPDQTHYPPGAIVVSIKTWREYLFNAGILDREAKNPRQPFLRLKNALSDKGAICEWGGLLWTATTKE